MAGFYRRFARNLAVHERALRELTTAKTPWIWGEVQQAAFDAVKRILSTAPVLAYPDFTLMNNFIITTDASQVGIGAVLSQTGADGVERPIFIASRVTTSGESRYAPTALEALAVVHYVEFFKPYVGASWSASMAEEGRVVDCRSISEAEEESVLGSGMERAGSDC
jgi:hypothetical protein